MKLTKKHAEDALQRWNDEAGMQMGDAAKSIFDEAVPNSAEGAAALYDLVGVIVMGYMGEELSAEQMIMAHMAGMDAVLDVAIQAAIIATLYAVDEAMKE